MIVRSHAWSRRGDIRRESLVVVHRGAEIVPEILCSLPEESERASCASVDVILPGVRHGVACQAIDVEADGGSAGVRSRSSARGIGAAKKSEMRVVWNGRHDKPAVEGRVSVSAEVLDKDHRADRKGMSGAGGNGDGRSRPAHRGDGNCLHSKRVASGDGSRGRGRRIATELVSGHDFIVEAARSSPGTNGVQT